MTSNAMDSTAVRGTPVSWCRYAAAYDLMATCNPAYAQLKDRVFELIDSLALPTTACVADLGAGTGEYSLGLARRHPFLDVHHVEPDDGMIDVARHKGEGLHNVRFVPKTVRPDLFARGELDLCVCVHALYAMPDPQAVLHYVRHWLKPGGAFVLCDLGRVLDVADWRRYIVDHLVRNHGWARAVLTLLRGREIARQNRRIRDAQLRGEYWTHTQSELVTAVTSAGFDVVSSEPCYRDYSTLIVARAR